MVVDDDVGSEVTFESADNGSTKFVGRPLHGLAIEEKTVGPASATYAAESVNLLNDGCGDAALPGPKFRVLR